LTLDGGSGEMPARNTHDGSYEGMDAPPPHSDSSSARSTGSSDF
jgi:hypothetical protein